MKSNFVQGSQLILGFTTLLFLKNIQNYFLIRRNHQISQ